MLVSIIYFANWFPALVWKLALIIWYFLVQNIIAEAVIPAEDLPSHEAHGATDTLDDEVEESLAKRKRSTKERDRSKKLKSKKRNKKKESDDVDVLW